MSSSSPSSLALSSSASVSSSPPSSVSLPLCSDLSSTFCAKFFGSGVPCALGIDEAGRGPVLGPMVYGAAWCPVEKHYGAVKRLGVMDSKMLNADMRDVCFARIQAASASDAGNEGNSTVDSAGSGESAAAATTSSRLVDGVQVSADGVVRRDPFIGWAIDPLHPHGLSTDMLRMNKINLNTISHNSAIGLIQKAIDAGVNVTEVYVDTVGQPKKYEQLLRGKFPHIRKIVVESKADATYPIVSAASICAKVLRDEMLKRWHFVEPGYGARPDASTASAGVLDLWNFGSGYPSDPNTKRWLRSNLDPVFGFPRVLRFSWKTAATLIKRGGYDVIWGAFDDDGDVEEGDAWAEGPQQRQRSQKKRKKKDPNQPEDEERVDRASLLSTAARKRFRFFAERNMERSHG